jgi:formamidopyrimidine-DNA glycosylase
MPELPEVQTTVNGLARQVTGRSVVQAWMDPEKYIGSAANRSWSSIRRLLPGRRIIEVRRHAKYIVIKLDDGSSLWIHQKMTGHLLVGQWKREHKKWVSSATGPLAQDPVNRFIRMVLGLDDGRQIALSDARRFAKIIHLQKNEEPASVSELSRIGPDALALTRTQFAQLFSGRRGKIKAALMNPACIAGIGNIYADEILHRAGINPFTSINRLEQKDFTLLHTWMVKILNMAIDVGGSSTDDYRRPDGTTGSYQDRHLAYHQQGKPCTLCAKGTIHRMMHNGRSSHFCPAHQRLLT